MFLMNKVISSITNKKEHRNLKRNKNPLIITTTLQREGEYFLIHENIMTTKKNM